MMRHDALTIARRFCGPPHSGNGGYVSGLLALRVGGTAAVRLLAPPPLETELRVEVNDDTARLFDQSMLVAEARRATLALDVPAAPSFAEAERAAEAYAGFRAHPFPTCFVCGPTRAPADGLRIFPGALAARSLVAAPWVPDSSLADGSQSVRPEFLWAALDCTGAFAFPQAPAGRAVVLGELCARIDDSVRPGEPCVAAAWPIGVEGRKRFAGSAVYADDGRPVAVARATWIEVAAQSFAQR